MEMKGYLEAKGESYKTINDIVGALEGAKAEFQRRIVAPYEDKKRQINGDVYVPTEVDVWKAGMYGAGKETTTQYDDVQIHST